MIESITWEDIPRYAAGSCAVICALGAWLRHPGQELKETLATVLMAGCAGAGIPSSLLMMGAYVHPEIYVMLPDLTVVASVCGVAVLVVSARTLRRHVFQGGQTTRSVAVSAEE